jgi:hypothetical protein
VKQSLMNERTLSRVFCFRSIETFLSISTKFFIVYSFKALYLDYSSQYARNDTNMTNTSYSIKKIGYGNDGSET